ncbi:hypothetical protein ACT4MK_08590 [Bradyrhizobium barranii]|jgi:hypothetical protein|uniref:hypothetical protein n=1 Tax=Bradyrhizobium TaxID=374 RepID=UPI00339B9E0F
MVDISAITGAITALKGANDIAQAMIGLRDAAAFQSKLIEFQNKILEAIQVHSLPKMNGPICYEKLLN